MNIKKLHVFNIYNKIYLQLDFENPYYDLPCPKISFLAMILVTKICVKLSYP